MDDLSDAIALAETGTYVVTRSPVLPFVNGLAVQAMLAAAWVTATVYPPGALVSNDGQVYQTTAGGTSGGTAPIGTGAAINDGGVLWNWVAPAATQFTASGSAQPMSGRELDRLPELYRGKENMVFFTPTMLRTVDEDGGPDYISVDGRDWQVSMRQNWAILGNFYKVTLTLVGR
jgi:hypothetical protein